MTARHKIIYYFYLATVIHLLVLNFEASAMTYSINMRSSLSTTLASSASAGFGNTTRTEGATSGIKSKQSESTTFHPITT